MPLESVSASPSGVVPVGPEIVIDLGRPVEAGKRRSTLPSAYPPYVTAIAGAGTIPLNRGASPFLSVAAKRHA